VGPSVRWRSKEAEHRHDHGRRCGHVEPQRLPPRHDGRVYAHIDRIAREGALFTDYYGQPVMHGDGPRSSPVSPFRTGLLKVGMPRPNKASRIPTQPSPNCSSHGLRVGADRQEHLGTATNTCHGPRFDEFYGILYHLNARKSPTTTSTPMPEFHERFGPRNILETKATNVDDPTEHPRWGGSASRRSPTAARCRRTPAWTRVPTPTWRTSTPKSSALTGLHRPSAAADTPFFLWHNATDATSGRTWPHGAGQSGFGLFADAMMELDWEVGQISTSSTSSASPITPSCVHQ